MIGYFNYNHPEAVMIGMLCGFLIFVLAIILDRKKK